MNLGKLIIDIDGPELTQEDKDILKHPNVLDRYSRPFRSNENF